MNVAIIDLGSNSVRLSIAEVSQNSFKNILMKRIMIKLSENMNSDMMLKAPAMERAKNALSEFKNICENFSCEKIITVATAAVRKAKNSDYFLNYIEENVGIKIKVISGSDEAKFDFYSVLDKTTFKDFIIMDIGGGSTEIISVKNCEIKNFESIPIGSRSITEEFLTPETSEKVEFAKSVIDEKINSLTWLSSCKNIPIIGLGGCLRAVGKALCKMKGVEFKSGARINSHDVTYLYNELKGISVKDRMNIEGIEKSRGDIILGGLMPFVSVSEKISATDLIISDSGVRDGILYAISKGIEI